ncbi:2-succinylbenzoate--CoA ligase [Quillaja saponaria]|uniref:2-succinylbenzoate--CoA ligase n=1 Tax=Quillaja saponaria TaxID=32244 RepID=A0AAD7M3E9_QUISA|nr:2-succinylbenzoate--CoA ligase [Quillaja saponaria]
MGNYSDNHICQCLSRILTLRRNSLVTISGDRRKSGEEFVEGVLSLAFGLLELGVVSGDVVAISAFNSDWYLEWLLAVAFVGGIAAPLNYRWSYEEARLAMAVVRPVILVSDESCYMWYSDLQKNDVPSLRWLVALGSPSSDLARWWNVLTPPMIKKHPTRPLLLNYCWASEGVAIICFTSGTTGKPKGVTITHGALIIQSLAKITIVGYSENDVYLHTAPLCHIGGLSSALAMLMVGGCHVLIPKFDAKLATEAIEQHSVTSLITVPAIMADLISLIRRKDTWKGRETLMKILNGGGGLSFELIKNVIRFFPRAKLISAYGMTETCSSLTFMTLSEPTPETSIQSIQPLQMVDKTKPNRTVGVCVGKPAPHVELKICADGSHHIGRILTRGPHLMLRYWGQIPGKPLDTRNGVWFDTGDSGFIDDHGNLWLIGRANDRIKSGGENIYPEEVEAILLQHPGIIGAVIVGIPDARLSERIVACVQLRQDWQFSENSFSNRELHLSRDTLQNYCREKNLSGFKIPKVFISWRKAFPLTSSGKVRREQVRMEVMSHLQSLNSNL